MKNKVFILPPQERWVVDEFVKEFKQDNGDICVNSPYDADVIWLLANWCWKRVPHQLLMNKKIITTIHHEVPQKFQNPENIHDFKQRDLITDVYHVYNEAARSFIKNYTSKPIHLIQYWANQNKWFLEDKTKLELKDELKLPKDKFLIGSFQRDTEGAGIPNGVFFPKLEKGPDLFVEAVEKFSKHKDVHVLLGGWRRQYVINELNKRNIQYSYFELPSQDTIRKMYQVIDLYIVGSRYEGGPMSLIECGLMNTPVISRNVGIATQVLPSSAINDNVYNAKAYIPDVSNLLLPKGYENYRNLIQKL